jgi:cobalt-zinc-cadmium efflux system protein
MGHEHHHGAAIGHAGTRHRWRLAAALALVGAFLGVELAVGLLSGSLALLSDAGHMAADAVTLVTALVATRVAGRSEPTGRRTYGSYRAEVFASGFAVLVMLGVAVSIVSEAVERLDRTAVEIATGPMMVVGGIGLCVNIAAMLLLRSGASESLNVKGAYLEVVADTAGSVGVVVAAALVAATGMALWDTLVAVAIGCFVVVRAVGLGRQVWDVLAQHAPAGIDPRAVSADLASIEGVQEVHDVHLWTLTSGMHVATVHLVTDDLARGHAVLDRARQLLRDRHGIAHATLQVEPADHTGCHELGW